MTGERRRRDISVAHDMSRGFSSEREGRALEEGGIYCCLVAASLDIMSPLPGLDDNFRSVPKTGVVGY